ncbi:hypothetical protein D3C72_1227180 [compost metagenome]
MVGRAIDVDDVEPLLAQQGAQAAQRGDLLEKLSLELQGDGAQAGQRLGFRQKAALAGRADRDLGLLAEDARKRHHIGGMAAAVALVEIGVENLHGVALVRACGGESSKQLQWRF